MPFYVVSVTSICRRGITTIVTLRCDRSIGNASLITLPPRCVTGTCDGCTYALLWRTREACPRCAPNSFTEFTDVCVDGKQQVLKIWPRSESLCLSYSSRFSIFCVFCLFLDCGHFVFTIYV